jgi:hypothetical protein
MTPKILPDAVADLKRGREFYDLQEPGIGDYFVQDIGLSHKAG